MTNIKYRVAAAPITVILRAGRAFPILVSGTQEPPIQNPLRSDSAKSNGIWKFLFHWYLKNGLFIECTSIK